MHKNTRSTGSCYERKAADYLKQQGLFILRYNYRCRFGEIDLIARDGEYLVFVEVKYRKTDNCGGAAEAVDHRKRHKITMAALYYMQKNNYSEWTPCRFDVLAIDAQSIQLYKNAFEACMR